jgi:DNA topoisomerase-2
VPWYMGFEGTIESNNDKFVSRGCFKKLSATKVEITDLPVGTWFQKLKIEDETVWEKIKNGEINGISPEVYVKYQIENKIYKIRT